MIQVFVTQARRQDFRLPEYKCQLVLAACLKFQPQKVETVIPEAHWLVRPAPLLSSEFQCRILLQRIKCKNNGRFLTPTSDFHLHLCAQTNANMLMHACTFHTWKYIKRESVEERHLGRIRSFLREDLQFCQISLRI